jgi:hypothetical protein
VLNIYRRKYNKNMNLWDGRPFEYTYSWNCTNSALKISRLFTSYIRKQLKSTPAFPVNT